MQSSRHYSVVLACFLVSGTYSKIFLFNGKPTTDTTWTTNQDSWESCVSLCQYDIECWLLYRNETTCQFFKLGNFNVQRFGVPGHRVAFKITDTSATCPLKADSQSYIENENEWTDGTLIYHSSLSYGLQKWKMTYTVSRCPNNTTLYTRVFGSQTFHVCVGFRLFPNNASGSYSDAQSLCKTDGGYGLTGPLNSEEYEELKAQGREITKSEREGRCGPKAERSGLCSALEGAFERIIPDMNEVFLWIDGLSYATKEYTFDDESHNEIAGYPFYPGEPNGEGAGIGLFMLWNGTSIGDFESMLDDKRFRGGLCRINDVPVELNV